MHQRSFQNSDFLIPKQGNYEPILSKLEIRFPKLKIQKKYQSPKQSPQRGSPLFKKNSHSSQDETKQQTKLENSSETTLQKLLEQLQDHSKKLYNVVYNKTAQNQNPQKVVQTSSTKQALIQDEYLDTNYKNSQQLKAKNNQENNNKILKSSSSASHLYYQRSCMRNLSENKKYQIKSSKQIVNQWRKQKFISKNLLGIHWQTQYAQKLYYLKKQAFQALKSQFCIQNGILATQSKFKQNPVYQKIIQKIGVGFQKTLAILKYKVLTKLRDSFIKIKFYNDISGVYGKENETTTSNKNMLTSFFQLSDNQINKSINQINQIDKQSPQDKSIYNSTPSKASKISKLSIKQIRLNKAKQSQKDTQKVLTSYQNSINTTLNLNSKISKINQKESKKQVKFMTPSSYNSQQDYQAEYKQQQVKKSQPQPNRKHDNQYDFRTPIKIKNASITPSSSPYITPKKDEMRIYPYQRNQQTNFQQQCKKQATYKSQQIQSYNSNQNNQIPRQSQYIQRIQTNYQNKRIIGKSMDQNILQRNSRSQSSSQMFNQATFVNSIQSIANVSNVRPMHNYFQGGNVFKNQRNDVQHQVRPNIQVNSFYTPNGFQNNNQIEARNTQLSIRNSQCNVEGNTRMQRCFSQQYTPLRSQANVINYPVNNEIYAGKLIYANSNQPERNLIQQLPISLSSRVNKTQNGLPVIFTNYNIEPNLPQTYARNSRSLSANNLKEIKPIFLQQSNQQSRVQGQFNTNNNQCRQRQLSTDNYARLITQPYIQQAKRQQRHVVRPNIQQKYQVRPRLQQKHLVRPIQTRQINSQYFIGSRQLQSNRHQSQAKRQNGGNIRNRF